MTCVQTLSRARREQLCHDAPLSAPTLPQRLLRDRPVNHIIYPHSNGQVCLAQASQRLQCKASQSNPMNGSHRNSHLGGLRTSSSTQTGSRAAGSSRSSRRRPLMIMYKDSAASPCLQEFHKQGLKIAKALLDDAISALISAMQSYSGSSFAHRIPSKVTQESGRMEEAFHKDFPA